MSDVRIYSSSADPRSRRKGGFGQGLLRLLFFCVVLIPTCIIAWRIDLVNPRQEAVAPPPQIPAQPRPEPHRPPQSQAPAQPPAQAQAEVPGPLQAQPEPAANTVQPARRFVPQVQAVALSETRPPLTNGKADQGEAVVNAKRPAKNGLQGRPRPSQTIVLEFDGTRQREAVSLSGALRVARVDGCKYAIDPPDGLIVSPVYVTLIEEPRPVVLAVSLAERNEALFLFIEPTVETDSPEESVPFTTRNLKAIRLRNIKVRNNTAKQLAAMRSELATLQALLDSPIGKPVSVYNRAVARIPMLQAAVPEGEQRVAALQTAVDAAEKLYQLAEKLHEKCSLVIEATTP